MTRLEADVADDAYYQFLTLRWETINIALLPKQHRELVRAPAGTRPVLLADVNDPLAQLLGASLLVMRQEADAGTLALATETASSQGWRRPLLTYLKLQEAQAESQGDSAQLKRLAQRIELVERSFDMSHK
jgi:hypothetical protein